MKFEVESLDPVIRLYHTVGRARITFKDKTGRERQLVCKSNDLALMAGALSAASELSTLSHGGQFQVREDFCFRQEGGRTELILRPITSIDMRRAKSPMSPLPVPDRFCAVIGRILATWGQFETHFDEFLTALLKANGTGVEAPTVRFRDRIKRFRQEMRTALSALPGSQSVLNATLDDAVGTYDDRNLLAHGMYECEAHVFQSETDIEPSATVTLIAKGHKKRQPIEGRYSYDDLNDLYYRVAHIAGRMRGCCLPDQITELVPSEEKPPLRMFIDANFPNLHHSAEPRG